MRRLLLHASIAVAIAILPPLGPVTAMVDHGHHTAHHVTR